MADFKALIAELEAAEKGSRELSDKVLLACGWQKREIGYWLGPICVIHWSDCKGNVFTEGKFPSPTKSVDDALSLVPEGWSIEARRRRDGWCVRIAERSSKTRQLGTFKAFYRPLPIALCIAALKAREAGGE